MLPTAAVSWLLPTPDGGWLKTNASLLSNKAGGRAGDWKQLRRWREPSSTGAALTCGARQQSSCFAKTPLLRLPRTDTSSVTALPMTFHVLPPQLLGFRPDLTRHKDLSSAGQEPHLNAGAALGFNPDLAISQFQLHRTVRLRICTLL